jgi:cell wall-associated NlpC family hydrolase
MKLKELWASRHLHQRLAHKYSLAAAENRRLARKRLRQVKAWHTKHDRPKGAKVAVAWALAQAGTVEHPAGSNWGPKIEDWIKASGYGGPVPWCQCFANAAAVQGGAPQLRTGFTPTVLNGIGGYKRIPSTQARAGDFVFYKWPGVSRDACDHVGVLLGAPANGRVETVEGNTSSGVSGSQNNGGGVYHRTDRSTAFVVGYVRPPYPN